MCVWVDVCVCVSVCAGLIKRASCQGCCVSPQIFLKSVVRLGCQSFYEWFWYLALYLWLQSPPSPGLYSLFSDSNDAYLFSPFLFIWSFLPCPPMLQFSLTPIPSDHFEFLLLLFPFFFPLPLFFSGISWPLPLFYPTTSQNPSHYFPFFSSFIRFFSPIECHRHLSQSKVDLTTSNY